MAKKKRRWRAVMTRRQRAYRVRKQQIRLRRTGALKYGLRLRDMLTESDWKALDDARMGDLR